MVKCGKSLRWFLFEDYLEMNHEYGLNIDPLVWNHLSEYTKIYKNPLIKFMLKGLRANCSLFLPILHKKGENTILFQNNVARYSSIINESSKKNAIILGLKKNALWNFMSKRTMYYPVFDNIYLDLSLGIMNSNEEQLYNGLDKLKAAFEYLNPDAIILNDDALHPSRAIIWVSKELGIPTVEIQHGIYQSGGIVPTGKYSDYVFVWGEYFKNIYLNRKVRKKNTIRVLGYPYELEKMQNVRINTPKTVYYLSEDFEHYNADLISFKTETMNSLRVLCKSLGFKFVYRPHPIEDISILKSKLPNITVSSRKEKLSDAFKKGDIFISFNSTALIEAKLHSKMCIQLKYYPLPTDDFEELGICPSYENVNEVEDYLKKISENTDLTQFQRGIASKYIEIPSPNPGTRFLELLNDII